MANYVKISVIGARPYSMDARLDLKDAVKNHDRALAV